MRTPTSESGNAIKACTYGLLLPLLGWLAYFFGVWNLYLHTDQPLLDQFVNCGYWLLPIIFFASLVFRACHRFLRSFGQTLLLGFAFFWGASSLFWTRVVLAESRGAAHFTHVFLVLSSASSLVVAFVGTVVTQALARVTR